jgi:hypothetical protein
MRNAVVALQLMCGGWGQRWPTPWLACWTAWRTGGLHGTPGGKLAARLVPSTSPDGAPDHLGTRGPDHLASPPPSGPGHEPIPGRRPLWPPRRARMALQSPTLRHMARVLLPGPRPNRPRLLGAADRDGGAGRRPHRVGAPSHRPPRGRALPRFPIQRLALFRLGERRDRDTVGVL